MPKITLEISTYLEKRQTDLSECFICEDTIYSDMYVYYLEVTGRPKEETNYKLCYSCYDCIGK